MICLKVVVEKHHSSPNNTCYIQLIYSMFRIYTAPISTYEFR